MPLWARRTRFRFVEMWGAMIDAVDEKLRRRAEEDRLAADILEECRVQLMLKFRFLDLALWRMSLQPVRAGGAYPLATNGHIVALEALRVIARFNQSFNEVVRDYLHMVLHCIFRHPYNADHKDREAWNLTCDIIVESVAMDMCAGRFSSEDDTARKEALSKIRLMAGDMLPGKVYSLVHNMVQTPAGQQYRGLGRSTLNEWHALFERDEHAAWPAMGDTDNKSVENVPEKYSEDESSNNEQAASSIEELLNAEQLPESMREQMQDLESRGEDEGSEGGGEDNSAEAELAAEQMSYSHEDQGADPMGNFQDNEEREDDAKEWEEISKQIAMNLDTFSKEWGEETNSFMQNLALVNRKQYDYSEFLRQFMVQNEEILVNPDEFDYVYYTYGIDLYGNMPLIEPLEYKETDRIRDFVIAIDTSESVKGDLVRRFVQHTFDILKSSQDYATDVNIHVIQSDSRLQEDMVIRDMRDVDALMERFKVRGFGGTDFRPVFDYVQGMRDSGKLTDMRGLIYFTDGLGTFPDAPPDFDAAFVFVEDEAREIPAVPPWAIKLVVKEETL